MKINGNISQRKFYTLSFTWGLITNIAGALVAGFMIICGKKPEKFGPCINIETGKHGDGFSMGMFIFTGKEADRALKKHELGHSIQNCYYGPLMPLIVNLPSSLRYHYRKIKQTLQPGKQMRDYYSIWFEKQATKLGQEFLSDDK